MKNNVVYRIEVGGTVHVYKYRKSAEKKFNALCKEHDRSLIKFWEIPTSEYKSIFGADEYNSIFGKAV